MLQNMPQNSDKIHNSFVSFSKSPERKKLRSKAEVGGYAIQKGIDLDLTLFEFGQTKLMERGLIIEDGQPVRPPVKTVLIGASSKAKAMLANKKLSAKKHPKAVAGTTEKLHKAEGGGVKKAKANLLETKSLFKHAKLGVSEDQAQFKAKSDFGAPESGKRLQKLFIKMPFGSSAKKKMTKKMSSQITSYFEPEDMDEEPSSLVIDEPTAATSKSDVVEPIHSDVSGPLEPEKSFTKIVSAKKKRGRPPKVHAETSSVSPSKKRKSESLGQWVSSFEKPTHVDTEEVETSSFNINADPMDVSLDAGDHQHDQADVKQQQKESNISASLQTSQDLGQSAGKKKKGRPRKSTPDKKELFQPIEPDAEVVSSDLTQSEASPEAEESGHAMDTDVNLSAHENNHLSSDLQVADPQQLVALENKTPSSGRKRGRPPKKVHKSTSHSTAEELVSSTAASASTESSNILPSPDDTKEEQMPEESAAFLSPEPAAVAAPEHTPSSTPKRRGRPPKSHKKGALTSKIVGSPVQVTSPGKENESQRELDSPSNTLRLQGKNRAVEDEAEEITAEMILSKGWFYYLLTK